MVLTETGLAKVFQRVKSFVLAQLNSKASVLHTHTYSDITDLPNGIAVDSTLDGTSSNAIANSAVKNALDGKISSEIDSMGEGWVRFKSGLQICYGMVVNDNNIETGKARFSFPKAFSASPNLVATPNNPDFYTVTGVVESGTTWTLSTFQLWGHPNIGPAMQPLPVNYVAIGKWN